MKHHYSSVVKGQVLTLRNEGFTYKEISIKTGVSISTISRIVTKFQQHNNTDRKLGSGRPKVLKSKHLSMIKSLIKNDSLISSPKIARNIENSTGLAVNPRTIRNFLNKNGFKAVIPVKKPFLKPIHIKRRLEVTKKWLFLGQNYWNDVVFSDETSFSYYNDSGRFKVWKESSDKTPLNFTKKFGFKKLMVWGSFSYEGVGRLHFVDGIMDAVQYVHILATNLPFIKEKLGVNRLKFQQDNDPKHTSRLTKEYFRTNNIDVLDWPSQSPDLNPIENLWSILKYKLRGLSFSTGDELKSKIMELWNNISSDLCKNLCLSMNKRIIECIRNKGHHISY